jgi:hypothetical protein
MRRQQIEVIRYRRVTVIRGSDRELDSTLLTATELPREEQDHVLARELMDAQTCTRIQRLAISSQRLLNHLRRRRGNHSTKFSTIDRNRRTGPR